MLVFCPKCGSEVNDNDQFCGKCGAAIKKDYYPNTVRNTNDVIGNNKKIIILAVCILAAAIVIKGIVTQYDREHGYEKCIEEHINEFVANSSYEIEIDDYSLYYEARKIEGYKYAIRGIVNYYQSGINGTCTLTMDAVYEEGEGWCIYNAKKSTPISY